VAEFTLYARKQSGDNENAILWTPLLTLFAKMDMVAPSRLVFLLYGEEWSRGDPKGLVPGLFMRPFTPWPGDLRLKGVVERLSRRFN
jgi:hypothetical protein